MESNCMGRPRSSYAIPMPYIPSRKKEVKEGEANLPSISIELGQACGERSSSGYSVACLRAETAAEQDKVGKVNSRAVVKASDKSGPNPLAKLNKNTDLNRKSHE